MDGLFLGEQHPVSGRRGTFEDNGTSAWLYLSDKATSKVVADAWVFNRLDPPPLSQIHSYRPDPPPAAVGYAGPQALCSDPWIHKWALEWSDDGESLAVLRDGVPVAMIVQAEGPGFSRHLTKAGPWGQVWNDELYRDVMQKEA